MDDSSRPRLSDRRYKPPFLPPKVRGWWQCSCWILFIVGVVLVLILLPDISTSNDSASTDDWRRCSLLVQMWFTFGFAGANTLFAAIGFTRRRDKIRRYMGDHADWLRSSKENREAQQKPDELDGSIFYIDAKGSESGTGAVGQRIPFWYVQVGRHFQPGLYQNAGPDAMRFDHREYIDFLAADVSSAQKTCGKMAGALGGLFVASLQVFIRL